jgi:hypothetical protein
MDSRLVVNESQSPKTEFEGPIFIAGESPWMKSHLATAVLPLDCAVQV